MARTLPEGIYEDLVTREVAEALDLLPPTRADVAPITLAEQHSLRASDSVFRYPHPVFSLRCTQRLLTRLKLPPDPHAPSPTTRLGDWYASVVQIGRLQLVLAVSERTLLPVLVRAAPMTTLVPRLRLAVGEALRAQDISDLEIAREDAEMADVVIAKTASRQATGILVDFAKLADADLEDGRSLHDVAVKLARTPCSPLHEGKGSPDRETTALFGEGLVSGQYARVSET